MLLPKVSDSPQNGNLPGSTLLAPHVNSFASSCNSGSRWAGEGTVGSKNCPVKLTFPGEPGPQAKHVSVLFVVPKITPGRKRRARPRPDLERPSSPGVSLSSLSCLVDVKLRCEEHPIQGAASCQHVSHFRLNVKWFHCGFSTSPTPALNFSHLLTDIGFKTNKLQHHGQTLKAVVGLISFNSWKEFSLLFLVILPFLRVKNAQFLSPSFVKNNKIILGCSFILCSQQSWTESRDFSCNPGHPRCTGSSIINIPPQSGTYVPIDVPALTQQSHPMSTVHREVILSGVYSMGLHNFGLPSFLCVWVFACVCV